MVHLGSRNFYVLKDLRYVMTHLFVCLYLYLCPCLSFDMYLYIYTYIIYMCVHMPRHTFYQILNMFEQHSRRLHSVMLSTKNYTCSNPPNRRKKVKFDLKHSGYVLFFFWVAVYYIRDNLTILYIHMYIYIYIHKR